MLGAATARSEAIVMRVATVYAVLDGRTQIGVEHLNAALAAWRYCADSARYVFGDAVDDRSPTSSSRRCAGRPDGMTRTQIRDLVRQAPQRRSDHRGAGDAVDRRAWCR